MLTQEQADGEHVVVYASRLLQGAEKKYSCWEWTCWARFPGLHALTNISLQESTGYIPAKVALGRKLKGPLERMVTKSIAPDHPAYAVVERQETLLWAVRCNVTHAEEQQGRYCNAWR